MKGKALRSRLLNLLKVGISAGMLVYVLVFRVDLRALAETVSGARWGPLAGAGALAIAGVALRAVRWLALLRALDIRVPLGRLVRLYFVGTFFNIFLLSGFGGDAIRMMELARHSKRTPEAIGTVLVDRATGLWVLFVLALLALPFGSAGIPRETVLLIAAVSVVGVVGGWLAMGTRLIPWLGSRVKLPGQAKLERFYRAVGGCGYVALGQACGISLAFNLLNITVNYLIARGFNVDLPYGLFFLFTPLVSLSLMLPSVGGLGVREETFRLVYGTVGVPDSTAVAMSLSNYGLQTLLPGLIGAVLYAVEGASELKGRPDPEMQE
ncbi:MAG: flippase-like domain-containing protein [Anaerolineae bacterium]|nr:flippase-like domain-containing protein [Anaerolineae bacterium]